MRSKKYPFLLYFLLLTVLTFWGVVLVRGQIIRKEDWVSWLWLLGFAILFFNVIHIFLISLFSLFCKPKPLPELHFQEFPRTALCYFLRNEEIEYLYKRLAWSFEGNKIPGCDFWLLSDSDEEFEALETNLVRKLEERHGFKVNYRRRKIPLERKQGNMREFIDSHPEYALLYICDADSLVPGGTILSLLKKALHPANQDIAVFQTFIKVAHAKTYYARFEGIASETTQNLFFKTYQALFGQTISFGHQSLVRRQLFQAINLPEGLLSHDNWDTALLDQMGYRVAFLDDVVTFDETPAHYIEARKREARWAQGTLQGWPLIFMKGISPQIRFLSFYSFYCYLSQPIFLFWFFLGLFSQSFFAGQLMSFKTNVIWFGVFMNRTLFWILLFSLFVVFFHKLVIVRSREDFKKFMIESLFSSFMYAGNFLYATIDLVTLPFKKIFWRPMNKNPYARLKLSETVRTLLPGTVLGLLGFWYLREGTPNFQWSSVPVFASFVFSIPAVYLSSKSM